MLLVVSMLGVVDIDSKVYLFRIICRSLNLYVFNGLNILMGLLVI